MEMRDPGAMDGNPLAAFTIPAEVAAGGGTVRAAGPMVKAATFESAAPGVETLTLAVPPVAGKLAGTVAVSCAPLSSAVASGAPFHSTVEVRRKLAPSMVRVKAGPPAGADAGVRFKMAGTGVFTAKVAALDVNPLGLISAIMT